MAIRSTMRRRRIPCGIRFKGVAGCVGDKEHMSSVSAMHSNGLKHGLSSHGGQFPRKFSRETHSVVFRRIARGCSLSLSQHSREVAVNAELGSRSPPRYHMHMNAFHQFSHCSFIAIRRNSFVLFTLLARIFSICLRLDLLNRSLSHSCDGKSLDQHWRESGLLFFFESSPHIIETSTSPLCYKSCSIFHLPDLPSLSTDDCTSRQYTSAAQTTRTRLCHLPICLAFAHH